MNTTREARRIDEQGRKEKRFSEESKNKKKEKAFDDQKLVRLLKLKDPFALTEIIKKYHEKLFSVANRICKNPADAEEVLQDVYMIAVNKIERFEERSTLSTWLYRITVNASLMKLRSQKMNKQSVSMDNLTTLLSEEENTFRFDEEAKSPDDTLMTRELYEHIRDSVETLPEIYQDVFFLRDIQGFSIKETSMLLKTTPAAVKSRLHRSRYFIQEKLKPYLCEN